MRVRVYECAVSHCAMCNVRYVFRIPYIVHRGTCERQLWPEVDVARRVYAARHDEAREWYGGMYCGRFWRPPVEDFWAATVSRLSKCCHREER